MGETSEMAGVAGAWMAFETEDGYPTDEWIDLFRQRAYCPGSAARFLVNELPGIADQVSCLRVDVTEMEADRIHAPGKQVFYATGGWSGAENLIHAMLSHFWIGHMHSKWERGGAYWFEVPSAYLSLQDARADALPSPPDPR